jgi:hypothetical protein
MQGSLRENVISALEWRKFPFGDWGQTGYTKPLESFIGSLEAGEIVWNYADPFDNTLHIRTSVINIRYSIDDAQLELREHHRRRNDGSIEYRQDWDGSVSEKIRNKETPLDAAIRGLSKQFGHAEPGFNDQRNYSLQFVRSEKVGPIPAKSYPPFEAIYHRQIILCVIQEKLFRSEYILVDPFKTTWFGWVEL